MSEMAALPMEVAVEEEEEGAHKMVLVNHLLLLSMMHHLPTQQEHSKRLGRSRAEPP